MSNNLLNCDDYKRIICLNSKEIFETPKEASEFSDTSPLDVVLCCKGMYSHAGSINGENLSWRYYIDFLNMSDKEISNALLTAKEGKDDAEYIKKIKGQIICINTEDVFDSAQEASEKTGISTVSIRKCCNKRISYCRNREEHRFIFMYYEEYKHTSHEELNVILDTLRNIELKKVINLRTNEVFDSVEKASNAHYISVFTIRQQCYRKETYSKHTMKYGPEWLYLDDYLKMKEEKGE